ncbi:unnamed protein product, partial [Didymodactylos carnosus]
SGDIIYVHGNVLDDGYFMGEMNGVQGLVPSNFLQEVTNDSPSISQQQDDIKTNDVKRSSSSISSDDQSIISSVSSTLLKKKKQTITDDSKPLKKKDSVNLDTNVLSATTAVKPAENENELTTTEKTLVVKSSSDEKTDEKADAKANEKPNENPVPVKSFFDRFVDTFTWNKSEPI